jgi:hypothetical protein
LGLTPGGAECRAIEHVRARAIGEPVETQHAITLHFHPDRLVAGQTILQVMQRDGLYRSQFETATSNGGLTAYAGGQRWAWESRIFGGAYDDAPPSARPKYGSLNYRGRSVGGSPRFGSAYFKLDASVLQRATFCFPDSYFEPEKFGVASRMALVAHAELSDLDELDRYIEAQVHGPVIIGRDCRALVLDPSFRASEVDRWAMDLAGATGIAIEWHAGFSVSIDELEPHHAYRGPEIVQLARVIADNGRLTPAVIGRAACSGRYDQQDLKRVWHLLARFGCQERGGIKGQ